MANVSAWMYGSGVRWLVELVPGRGFWFGCWTPKICAFTVSVGLPLEGVNVNFPA
jgi:hypothetical protein